MRSRRARMVAGDHDDAHAGGVRLGDRRPRLGPGRVDDADHAQVDELALDVVVAGIGGTRREWSVGDGERAQGQVGEAIDRGEHLGAAAIGEGRTSPATRSCGAAGQQDVGGSLGDDGDAAPRARRRPRACSSACAPSVNGTSPTRSKRASRASVRPIFASATRKAASVGSPWTATRRPPRAARRRWRGFRRRARSAPRRAGRVVERTPVDAQLTVGPVARAGDVDLARRGDDLLDRHLVLRQRAGLVGAHDRRRAQRLDRRELLTIARRRAIRCTPRASTTDSTAGRPSGTAATASETPTSSTSTIVRGLADVGGEQDGADTTTTAMTITAMPSIRPMRSTSRCSGVCSCLVPAEQPGDVAHLSCHAGRCHQGAPAPPGDRRAVEDHVEPVADARLRLEWSNRP